MMFGVAKPVPPAPSAGKEEDDNTTSDDVEAELAAMRSKPKPAMKVIPAELTWKRLYKTIILNRHPRFSLVSFMNILHMDPGVNHNFFQIWLRNR
jgi:hypothetical protein